MGPLLVEILRRLGARDDTGEIRILSHRQPIRRVFPLLGALLATRELLASLFLTGELLLPFLESG